MNTEEPLPGEKIREYGLKIKLFIFDCVLRHDGFGDRIANEFKSNLDYFDEDPYKIFENIRTSKFIQYSTILIVVNAYCRCRIHILEAILYCIRQNDCLRYKLKLIILNYVERCHNYNTRQLFYLSSDEAKLNCGKYDNVIIFQNNIQNELDISQSYLIMLLIAHATPLMSAQQLLKHCVRPTKHELVRTSTNADLYFYAINPALAIIINNYYFSSPLSIREGSELDVIRLIRELKIARIPYILVEDCDRHELLSILEYVEKKNFAPLKSFLFFLMSHGDSNNVIYTHDGQLNINSDIVGRIQTNKSLEDAEKLIVVNACRGSIDMEYADYNDLNEIKPTDGRHLNKNTVLLYSVPDSVQSPRSEEEGCPFVSSFCQHFRHIDHTDDIRIVDDKIDADLKQIDYYEGLTKRSDLVLGDQRKCHSIIQIPKAVDGMIDLIESILCDFPSGHTTTTMAEGCATENLDDGEDENKLKTLFYIAGTLNERKFPKMSNVMKYFAPELDED